LEHRLFIKRSKCVFGTSSVAYLGHVISTHDIAMDELKIKAVVEWPVAKSVHAMRAFLGLAGYYCHFICDYVTIVVPLSKLL
jgi:hypothetical protein